MSQRDRGSRRSDTNRVINKRKKVLENYKIPISKPHKLSKMNGLNCGNPKCLFCSNPRKIFNEITLKERSFLETEKWVDDE